MALMKAMCGKETVGIIDIDPEGQRSMRQDG
jgi:hypothetical protein